MKVEQVISKQLVLKSTVGDFMLNVFYQSDKNFLIEVTQISINKTQTRTRMSTHEPIFGVDQEDYQWILADAEAMCEELEAESKEKANEES